MSDEPKQINDQSEELEQVKSKSEEYLNNWKRERADFINYKKDEIRRLGEIIKFANESLILEMIDVLDNLEMAIKHASPDVDKEWLKGLEHVQKDFMELLNKYGVERIKTTDNFDPELHEMVGEGEGDKVEELRAGYTMHGKVIRPARVKIIK